MNPRNTFVVNLNSGLAATRRTQLGDRERFGPVGPSSNARMGRADLDRHAVLGRGPRQLLVSACRRLGLTARGYDRVRRVARTLADLEGIDSIFEHHVAEAVQYRRPVIDRDAGAA